MYTTPQLHESAGTIDGLRAKLQAQAAELQRLSKVELQLAEEAERSRQLRTQSGALQATNDSLTMRVEVMRRQEAAAAEEGVQLRKRSKLLDEDNAQLLRLMQERSSSFETERDALERQVPPTSAPALRLTPAICHICTGMSARPLPHLHRRRHILGLGSPLRTTSAPDPAVARARCGGRVLAGEAAQGGGSAEGGGRGARCDARVRGRRARAATGAQACPLARRRDAINSDGSAAPAARG